MEAEARLPVVLPFRCHCHLPLIWHNKHCMTPGSSIHGQEGLIDANCICSRFTDTWTHRHRQSAPHGFLFAGKMDPVRVTKIMQRVAETLNLPILVLKSSSRRKGKWRWRRWCPLILRKMYADIGSNRETGVQINTSALVPNRVISWNGTGMLAH